jgi:hypothetical protein
MLELNRLKNEHRKLRGFTMGLLAIAATLVVCGAADKGIPDYLEAREGFLLRNSKGEVMASLRMRPNETPALMFYGRTTGDNPQFILGVEDGGNRGLFLCDHRGKKRLMLGEIRNDVNSVGLFVMDGSERPRLGAYVESSGASTVGCFDDKNQPQALLNSAPGGGSKVTLTEKSGKKEMVLRVGNTGQPELTATDGGQTTFKLPPSK